MELEEHDDDDEEGDLQDHCDCSYDDVGVEAAGLDQLDVLVDEQRQAEADGHQQRQNDVEQEQDEEFAVGVPDAVANPGAVVVHVEYAPLAGPAVVAPSLSWQLYLSGLKLWHNRQ